MEFAININAVLPVRAEASERSEQVTQLLFGEYCQIMDEQASFVKIKNTFDGYEGWVDAKMLTSITEDEFNELNAEPVFRTIEPICDIFCLSNRTIYRLTAGSLIPHYNTETSKFEVGGLAFQIHPTFVSYLPEGNLSGVVATSHAFINTPYLWGGKHVLGIDCSGLVQVVFSMNGIDLPRDASQQVHVGETIAFDEAQAGDLLYFEKEGRITHVGIYLGDQRIIHASGKVKIDRVDARGIFLESGDHTHQLAVVKTLRDH